MSIEPGTYTLGPENGTLSVHTGRSGAAAKAGHDLLIEVDAWGATVEIGADAERERARADGRLALAARARGHRRHAGPR